MDHVYLSQIKAWSTVGLQTAAAGARDELCGRMHCALVRCSSELAKVTSCNESPSSILSYLESMCFPSASSQPAQWTRKSWTSSGSWALKLEEVFKSHPRQSAPQFEVSSLQITISGFRFFIDLAKRSRDIFNILQWFLSFLIFNWNKHPSTLTSTNVEVKPETPAN